MRKWHKTSQMAVKYARDEKERTHTGGGGGAGRTPRFCIEAGGVPHAECREVGLEMPGHRCKAATVRG